MDFITNSQAENRIRASQKRTKHSLSHLLRPNTNELARLQTDLSEFRASAARTVSTRFFCRPAPIRRCQVSRDRDCHILYTALLDAHSYFRSRCQSTLLELGRYTRSVVSLPSEAHWQGGMRESNGPSHLCSPWLSIVGADATDKIEGHGSPSVVQNYEKQLPSLRTIHPHADVRPPANRQRDAS